MNVVIRYTDPKVQEFLRYLGVNLHRCMGVTITIEAGKPVEVLERRRCEAIEEQQQPEAV